MAARIEWTDEDGPAVLQNAAASVANGVGARFRGWTPFRAPAGPREVALGTGRSHMFRFRTDFGARFTMTELPATSLETAMRLQAWLLNGGSVNVYTDDAAGRSYPTCGLAPGEEPVITMTDPALLLYSIELSLINIAATPVALLCEYAT